MPQFVVVYLGGNPPSSPEEGQKHFAEYIEWLATLGEAAVSPANPLKDTRTMGPDGSVSDGGQSTMSGYTILQADSMDEALSMVKTCPFLKIGGSLEVSERVEMPGLG